MLTARKDPVSAIPFTSLDQVLSQPLHHVIHRQQRAEPVGLLLHDRQLILRADGRLYAEWDMLV